MLIPFIAAVAATTTEILWPAIGAIGIGCAVKGVCDSQRAKDTVREINALKKAEEESLEDNFTKLNKEFFDFERMKTYSNQTLEQSMRTLSQHKNDS